MDQRSTEGTRERTSDTALWDRAQPGTWLRFAPARLLDHPVLQGIAAWTRDPENRRLLHRSQSRGEYPREAIAALREQGLSRLLGRDASVWHSAALNALLASVDGSAAITVGVNFLALLPVHLDASSALRDDIFRRIDEGAFASLLLTEWKHGSNLARNETHAVREAELYRIRGSKQLINGGREHELLIVLARSAENDAAGGLAAHTLFALERTEGVSSPSRWKTLPARGADISDVDIRDVPVPESRAIGTPGEGFAVIRRALTLSRGGVSALAAGAAAGAVDMAWRYAAVRDVYGGPILQLDAIAHGIAAALEAEAISAAASLRAIAWANAFGLAAAAQTAAAKVVSAAFAEKAIDEGRRVLAARALLEDLPYAAFSRDVLLYGVFDGTVHVMLDELAFRFERLVTAGSDRGDPLAREREAWEREPRRLSDCGANVPVLRVDLRGLATAIEPCAAWPAAACLAALVDALFSVHADLGRRDKVLPQALRFELGECYALVETACGMFVIGDPGVRTRMGLAAPPRAGQDDAIRGCALESGAASLCRTIAERLARLRRSTGAGVDDGFAALGPATVHAARLRATLVAMLTSHRAGDGA